MYLNVPKFLKLADNKTFYWSRLMKIPDSIEFCGKLNRLLLGESQAI